MSSASGHWDDLLPRILSALALAGVGLAVTWFGGLPFNVFTALVASIMIWELARMFDAGNASLWLAIAGFVALVLTAEIASGLALPVFVVIAGAATGFVLRLKLGFAAFTFAVLVAAYGVMLLREQSGFSWMVWFAFVVVATDVGGYFAGRIFGGPKIWPKLSPKKTWSGTVAGWFAAAGVSIPFAIWWSGGWSVLLIGAALAFAGQLGDLWESAMKRHVGVKDASGIMPGHGGLLDRFDSMVGSSLLLLLIGQVSSFPPSIAG